MSMNELCELYGHCYCGKVEINSKEHIQCCKCFNVYLSSLETYHGTVSE